MSSYKIIPKDKAGRIERWQCPNVEHMAGDDNNPQSIGPITAEAIEKIQKQAFKEAYDEGFAKGYKEGNTKGNSEFDAQLALLKKSLIALSRPFDELDQEVEQQLTQLAINIARQLVRREIKTEPGQIIAIVREAILALPSAAKKVYVYLHPEDVQLLKTKLTGAEAESYWRLMEDPILSRGDCRVMTDTSTIDASVERRLSTIAAKLLGGEREED